MWYTVWYESRASFQRHLKNANNKIRWVAVQIEQIAENFTFNTELCLSTVLQLICRRDLWKNIIFSYPYKQLTNLLTLVSDCK